MIEFKNIELRDKEWIEPILKKSNFQGAEYSFTTNFIWRNVYKYKCTQYDNFYIVSVNIEGKECFLYPAGNGDLKKLLLVLENYCKLKGIPFVMIGITKENTALMEALFPEKYEFKENRDSFDYIYNFDTLKTLKGKKYHSKRNHVNRFKENNWRFEPLSADNLPECILMNNAWCKENKCKGDKSKEEEMCAVANALKYYTELNLSGGLLRLDNRIVAYTIGEPLNSDTLLVHIEKAFAGVNGAYPAINQEFVNYMGEKYGDFKFVNREDDAGVEGLRKAKLSYRPAYLLEKYTATIQ